MYEIIAFAGDGIACSKKKICRSVLIVILIGDIHDRFLGVI